ncbi:hypothetical protein KIV40_28755 [Vibrio sp. D173a]|uniref:hypothetical protein n=1 Tax=Vibrio sp. D173a TaxID=2836349 RepID=UPI00255744AB|nr:hypothetical protein [Vibrio sp. D173a]MDK9759222.1 hypothetical protein [Vibrio sp. D173a]
MQGIDSYEAFINAAKEFIPQERIITDYLRKLAYGTDASFYRLVPKVIVQVANEQEVIELMTLASQMSLPIIGSNHYRFHSDIDHIGLERL